MDIICADCKSELQEVTETEFGDEIDMTTPWEQYLCQDCFDKIWKELMDKECPGCRSHPCERGRECWINPFPSIMYLCYVAPKVGMVI